MKTYQDLQEIGTEEKARMEFVLSVINDHKSSEKYKEAKDAEEYAQRRNITARVGIKKIFFPGGAITKKIYSSLLFINPRSCIRA